jgi:uncharacterized membrane protein
MSSSSNDNSSISSSSPSSPSSSNSDSSLEPALQKRVERILTVEVKRRAAAAAELAKSDAKLQRLQELHKSYLDVSSPSSSSTSLPSSSSNNNSPRGWFALGFAQESVKETPSRSALKALLWRLIAGSVTFVTAVKFSGSVSQATSIVMSDFISKSLTMFIGERLMNNSQAGRKKGGDAVGRSLMKALIWRVFALFNTLVACVFISKNWNVAGKIASSDAIIKTGMMFVYERVWAYIDWGKVWDIDFSI